MAPDDEQFVPLMTKFAHAARAHISDEEQQVWPGLRTALSAGQVTALGEKLARATKAWPDPAASAHAAQPGGPESRGPGRGGR